jgi:hypothetical protein
MPALKAKLLVTARNILGLNSRTAKKGQMPFSRSSECLVFALLKPNLKALRGGSLDYTDVNIFAL